MLNLNYVASTLGFDCDARPTWISDCRGQHLRWDRIKVGNNCEIAVGCEVLPSGEEEFFLNVFADEALVDALVSKQELPFKKYVEKNGKVSADLGDETYHDVFVKALKAVSKAIFAQPMKLESGLTGWRKEAFNGHEKFFVRKHPNGSAAFYDHNDGKLFFVTSKVKNVAKLPSGTMLIDTESGHRYSVTI